jgi:hypothetical protein
MNVSARIDPRLQWFKPEFASAWATARTIAVSGKRIAYEVDSLAALRAFAYKVRDVSSAVQFVREYGPLVEPDATDKVSVADMVKTQRALVAVWKEWRALDARTLKQWREVAADFGTQVLPARLLTARQKHVAPLLARARLSARLEFNGAGLVLRPNDLQSAMWLVIAQRVALGDASIPCRNAGCGNYVSRSLADGNSMRAVYCEETRDRCTKAVRRGWERGHKEVDRYPHLERLKGAAFLDAARKLRGEEVL